jgi:DNA-binding NtrC family response regulator
MTPADSQGATPKRRLLILDDETIVGDRLKPAFEKAGYAVEIHADSAEALDGFAARPADIVITDLKMKGLDGIGFIERIKAMAPLVGIIVVTGYATEENVGKSFHNGAFDCVIKPFKLADILDAVARLETFLNITPLAAAGIPCAGQSDVEDHT